MSKKLIFKIEKKTYSEDEIIDMANIDLEITTSKGKKEKVIKTISKAINELTSRGIRVEKK